MSVAPVLRDDRLPEGFGLRLRRLRLAHSLAVDALERACGLRRASIQQLEAGYQWALTLPQLVALANTLRVGLDELYYGPVQDPARCPTCRQWRNTAGEIRVGDWLKLRPDRPEIEVQGRMLKLSPREHQLLVCLARRAGQNVKHEAILEEVWGIPGDERRYSYLIHQLLYVLRRRVGLVNGVQPIERIGRQYGFLLRVEC